MTKQTILIADDVSSIRQAIAGLLCSCLNDPEIEEAKNGLEAVMLSRTKKYDLILMDIRMPVMDGITATRLIHDENNCSKTILMTLSPKEDYEGAASSSGAIALISKTDMGNALPKMLEFLKLKKEEKKSLVRDSVLQ